MSRMLQKREIRPPRTPSPTLGLLMRFSARSLLPPGVDAGALPLLAARGLRALADGYMAVLLPAYLLAIGLGTFEVGIVATATMLGSAVATLAVGSWGHSSPTFRPMSAWYSRG